jgi:hypothetical protein
LGPAELDVHVEPEGDDITDALTDGSIEDVAAWNLPSEEDVDEDEAEQPTTGVPPSPPPPSPPQPPAADEAEGTAAYYRSKSEEPIYPGARVTVLQACYCLLTHKLSNKFGDVAFDELLRLLHEVFLPEGNLLPPSLYILRKVLGCSNWDEFELHVCSNPNCGAHVWPYLPRAQYEEHKDDACPCCATARFKPEICGVRTTWQPLAWYIDFGVSHTVQQFFYDPEFRELHDAVDRTPSRGSYWGGSEALRLAGALESDQDWADISSSDTGLYELCLDWLEPFKSVKYSVGILGIRRSDLPTKHKNRSKFVRVLAVIPGPKIPSSVRAYLLNTMGAFKLHGLRPEGIKVGQLLLHGVALLPLHCLYSTAARPHAMLEH